MKRMVLGSLLSCMLMGPVSNVEAISNEAAELVLGAGAGALTPFAAGVLLEGMLAPSSTSIYGASDMAKAALSGVVLGLGSEIISRRGAAAKEVLYLGFLGGSAFAIFLFLANRQK